VKLTVTTPLSIVVDADDVVHVRAEDESGAFGILERHGDFITALAMSVISWRDSGGREHHVAVRGGMLEVRGGSSVVVATREAVPGDDLHRLETDVLDSFRRRIESERAAHADSAQLYTAAIRQIQRLLRPGTGSGTTAAAVRASESNAGGTS
jgi:F-type H+-transporting ATPase subunit epsilon